MKTTTFIVLTLAAAVTAQADFSYTSIRKVPTGLPGAGGGPSTSKHYLKGQKLKTDDGDTTMILDFDAQTITSISHAKKIYYVTKFSDLGDTLKQTGMETKIDLKETGQKKTIGDYTASQVVMTMEMESPQSAQAGMKMQMEMEMWLSSDVPGSKELNAFYQRNSGKFPWAALGGGGNGGMQKAMTDAQRKMVSIGGVPLVQITRMKAGGAASAQMAQAQPAMDQARARLEAMIKQGGPGADAAKQALARMGAMSGGSGGALFEITTESSGFSAKSIPDSEFAIPAGYTKTERPTAPTPPTAPGR